MMAPVDDDIIKARNARAMAQASAAKAPTTKSPAQMLEEAKARQAELDALATKAKETSERNRQCSEIPNQRRSLREPGDRQK